MQCWVYLVRCGGGDWLLSRPSDLILAWHTQLALFRKTPNGKKCTGKADFKIFWHCAVVLGINKSICDLWLIFFLEKRHFMRFCMVYQKHQMYIYCIHLFRYLSIIPSQSIIGNILSNLWQKRLEFNLVIIIADFSILAVFTLNFDL